jgi:hypothetical protein
MDNWNNRRGYFMRKALVLMLVLGVVMFLASSGWAGKDNGCATIEDGTIYGPDGVVIETGFDESGYNYQAHLFNGYYCKALRDPAWCEPYKDFPLKMKWNDAWMSNKDCDGDGLLDRHYGYDTYIGSGAWLTNHQSGEYESGGMICSWKYFVKVVAVPEDAVLKEGMWYTADGKAIGPKVWEEFAIIEELENDPCAGQHGLQYNSSDHSGLGN